MHRIKLIRLCSFAARRSWEFSVTSPSIRLLVIETINLKPLDRDIDAVCLEMDRKNNFIVAGSSASAEVNLSTETVNEDLRTDFPVPLQTTEELLMWCRSSAIDLPEYDQKFGYALLAAHPRRGKFRLYPQDWFNGGGFDYMYQWLTRTVRDPHTGYVHGEGIRIRPFVLDDSLRSLREPLGGSQ